MKRIAIVGAGVRGLSSAACLKQRGYSVQVFDQAPRIGGIWDRVFPSSSINTPYFGYTFHPSNIWPRTHPTRDDILFNLDRLVKAEGLESALTLNTPVLSVHRSERRQWAINGEPADFDGVLVCTGITHRPKEPEPARLRTYKGILLSPYDFDPTVVRGNRVVVVGSGATALEMLKLCQRQGCDKATLLTRPNTLLLDLGSTQPLAYAMTGHPFVYELHRRLRGRPARVAACEGIDQVLARSNIQVQSAEFDHAQGRTVFLADGSSHEADMLIWCTGWHAQRPGWVQGHSGYASFVIAQCRACLNTAGFGHGTSTAHAKALDAALRFELAEPFRSDSQGCNCEQDKYQHSEHIVGTLLRYFLRQKRGKEILARNLRFAAVNHRRRWRESGEHYWVKLSSPIQAPLGL